MPRDTLIDLIRHGEPEGGRMIRGHGVDHPLSALGWAQMRAAVAPDPSAPGGSDPAVAATGAGHVPWQPSQDARWDQILSSPMARCREFALELAGRHGLPLAVDPVLKEIGMGAWEGRRPEEVARTAPAAYADFLRDPLAYRPPGGEDLLPFIGRISAAFDGHLAAYPGRRLLIVCHAGVSRAVIGHVLRADPARWYRLRIDYAGLTRIRCGRFGPAIEYINARRLR